MSESLRSALRDEAAGWLRVGEVLLDRGNLLGYGLCMEVSASFRGGIEWSMLTRLGEHCPEGRYLEEADGEERGSDDRGEPRLARVLFCCLMAAICEDEAKALKSSRPEIGREHA